MRKKMFLWAGFCFLVLSSLGYLDDSAGHRVKASPAGTPYSLDANYIEACSCMLFCPCYLNEKAHHEFCQFNMAVVVNDGAVGDVSLKGVRYWLAGDLGNEWGTEGKAPWLIITYDPSMTPAQREALGKVLGKIYPLEWADVQTDEAKFTWSIDGDQAHAKLANGKGEVLLERHAGADGGKIVMNNIPYFGAKKNHGFELYKSKINSWDGFGRKFKYSGRNAFTIRLETDGTL